jgi:hypothetical protein
MEAGKTGKKPSKDKPAANDKPPAKSKPTAAGEGRDTPRRRDRTRRLRGAVIALALLVGVIAWLATRGDDSSSPESATRKVSPTRIVTVDELRQVAARLEQPIYWAGPVAGMELELKELDEGVQLAYLPKGTPAGEGPDKVLTLGSYPLPDPVKSLQGFAQRPGAIVHRAGDGRTVVVSEQTPNSVYFASPDNSVQVEVYDPSPRRALNLALTGRAQPAG